MLRVPASFFFGGTIFVVATLPSVVLLIIKTDPVDCPRPHSQFNSDRNRVPGYRGTPGTRVGLPTAYLVSSASSRFGLDLAWNVPTLLPPGVRYPGYRQYPICILGTRGYQLRHLGTDTPVPGSTGNTGRNSDLCNRGSPPAGALGAGGDY
eukprot:512260-Rhodomonas_salina.1